VDLALMFAAALGELRSTLVSERSVGCLEDYRLSIIRMVAT
jgi:hypothetical protein